MPDFQADGKAFAQHIQSVIDEHWERVGPLADPDADPLEAAEMENSYPGAWVLIVGSFPLEPDGLYSTTRFVGGSQSPLTTIGLVTEVHSDLTQR